MFCLDLLNNKERGRPLLTRERLRELPEREEPTPPLTSMCEFSPLPLRPGLELLLAVP